MREVKAKWKSKVYAYDFSFTILWSVFISSSGRPFKGPLVDRSEVLWSTDQRLLGRPTRDPQNDVERNWTKIEWKLNEKADFRTVLERDWTRLNETDSPRWFFPYNFFMTIFTYDIPVSWLRHCVTQSPPPRFRYSLRYILRISWMIWTYLVHFFWVVM